MSDTLAAILHQATLRQMERARTATLELQDATIAHDAANGAAVGALNVRSGTGTYTFTLTDDAGGLFAIDGAVLEKADTLVAGEKYTVEVTADNGVDDPTVKHFQVKAL